MSVAWGKTVPCMAFLGGGSVRGTGTAVRTPEVSDVVDFDRDIPLQVKHICLKLLELPESTSCEITQIKGGITNLLYKVEAKGHSPVLVRIFGKAGDIVCERESENRIFADLAAQQFGPALHGFFGNGRIEGWLDGRRPLEPIEMLQTTPVDLVSLNAARLAQMHKLRPPAAGDAVAGFWPQIRNWSSLARGVTFPAGSHKAKQLDEADLERILSELPYIEALMPSEANDWGHALTARAGSIAERRAREELYNVCFCHNDLLAGNVMYAESGEGDVTFIDYEYASYNHVGFDIANHFNAVPESMLIVDNTFDVPRYYPTCAGQKHFLSAYFEARGMAEARNEDFLNACCWIIAELSVAAEIRWVIWSVVQAGYSPVDFDYLDYTRMRFYDGYLEYKRRVSMGQEAFQREYGENSKL